MENQKNIINWLNTIAGSIFLYCIGAAVILGYRTFLISHKLPMTLSHLVFWAVLLLIPYVKRPVVYSLLLTKTITSIYFILHSPRAVSVNGIISNIVTIFVAIAFGEILYRTIDGLKKVNEQLSIESQKAYAASEAKAAFLANMSHEIRTPLSGIRGITEMMMSRTHSPEDENHLQMIHTSSMSLLDIVNNVLDFSRIESGKETLQNNPVVVRDVVSQCLTPIELTLIPDTISFHTTIDNSVPTVIRSDEMKLRQIMTNLLSNAVKFTDRGTVSIDVSAKDSALHIAVIDTGIGIAPEKYETIFTEFERIQTSYEKYREGTGLGLAITKKNIEQMGGTIAVSSVENSGTTFTVTLPYEEASFDETSEVEMEATAEREEETQSNSQAILVAEDNKVNQVYLKHFLEKEGFDLTIVENGEEAINSFIENEYGIVLMDIQMPVKSGLQAVKEIREYEAANVKTKTPILALTASVTNHEQQLFMDSGMDGVCPKPIDMKYLMESIQKHLN